MDRHWRIEWDQEQLAWLHFDMAESSVNLLSLETLEVLDSQLQSLQHSAAKGLVILSDKPAGFMAGADVKGFALPSSEEQIKAHLQQVHAILQRLEELPFPTLALIHGFCLGGGLELALACDYRIARDDPATQLGFPEVRLGIFPGYGGTARSFETLAPLDALRLMLSGRNIDARRALHIGLVDRIAAERLERITARHLLKEAPPKQRPKLSQRILNSRPLRLPLAWMVERQTAKRVRKAHYPAPFALIDHWRHAGDQRAQLFEGEAQRVPRLLRSKTAQNLIHVFFLQERLKSLGNDSGFKPQHLHVIGGGVMGGDIAAWCALKGLRVSLQDREAKYLSRALASAHQLFSKRLKSRREVQAAMDRLMPDPKGNGIAHADVIIEAVFEDTRVKQSLFRKLEARARPNALLASNTSSIPLEIIGVAMRRPERLIGLHFFNPVARMQLVEVVHGEQTAAEQISRGASFARRIDKLPVPVKSYPGFLVNRVLMPYLLEAMELLEEGVPGPVIDKAAVDFGMPVGPIELADRVGLDICLAVAKELSAHYPFKLPGQLEFMVRESKLGLKSGEGFYRWEKKRPLKQRFDAFYHAPNDLAERLIFRLLNEAVACFREGVVEDADLLDAGIIFGTGFAPFRGGPMHYIKNGGLQQMRQRIQELERRHGEQFHPDSGWTNLGRV
jgi:3-hydroxyacyl-CoA dehydrogenase/enoyl-CoA hydratase/3-hydroxybutyryl-CoA epimerase